MLVLAVSVALLGGLAEKTIASEIDRESVVREINVRRQLHGLPLLRDDERLHRAAEDRMAEMERSGYWGHYPPDGSSAFDGLRGHGYPHRLAAENLAAGYESVESLVDGWMSSPGHRANMLSPLLRDLGVAVIDGGTTGRLMGRSVVVLFAREMEPD